MKGLRTWLEIDTSAIKQNYKVLRKMIGPHCLLMAVVKSNAYGHDLVNFSRTLQKLGANWFGVDSITEAIALRKNGIRKPILVLGYTLPERFKDANKHNVCLTISSMSGLRNLSKPTTIHLKMDTGMHRQGLLMHELPRAIQHIKKNPYITLEGFYTHLASAENISETKLQIAKFRRAIEATEKSGFKLIKHATATAGSINSPAAFFDMVRIGIGLYGLWPTQKINKAFSKSITLYPALTWKTVINEIKYLSKGGKIGYGFTETLEGDSTIAICPIGYWHGYPRALSRIGNVLVRGKRAKILGKVSMDMITIDISNHKRVKPGDVVTLIGRDAKEEITADELAQLTGTINYEIVTRINPLIKKFYI